MYRARWGVAAALCLTGICGSTASVEADQGFSVYEHSACTAGRGGAGVASPCKDGSAIHYNPAGLVNSGGSGSIGGSLIRLRSTFTPDEGTATHQKGRFAPTGHAYATLRANEHVAFGIGVFAPYGLALEWPSEFRGAFTGSRGELIGLYIQPTAALEVFEWLQVGAGIDFVFASVELEQALDLATVTAAEGPTGPVTFGELGVPHPTRFASASMWGSTWSTGWHLGTLLHVTDEVSFGVRYMSEVRNEFKRGRARFTQRPTGIVLPEGNPLGIPGGTSLDAVLASQFEPTGPLREQTVSTELTFPAELVLGMSADLSNRLRLYADYVLTDWSAYREIRLNFAELEPEVLIQDFEDVGTIRLGAEFDATAPLVVRLGFSHNGPAAPDATVTPLLPDSRRSGFYLGLGTELSRRARVDMYGIYTHQADRRGRLLPRPSRDIPAEELNEGVFSGGAFDLGATLSYAF